MEKIFGIYFSDPEVLDYPLNKKVFYESYAEILEVLSKNGIKGVIVRNKTYLGNGEFSHYFIWDGKKYKKIYEKIKISLLWNKDSENIIPKIDDLEILNSFEFDEICRDKILTYEKFKEFGAKTFLLNNFSDFQKKISEIKTKKVVLKPRFGEQCKGVEILNKEEITENLYNFWENIIMQEFLDSRIGIPGLAEGLHEINVFIVNGNFSGARLKIPPKGSLKSSATGDSIGKVKGLKKSEVPKSLLETIGKLDEQLKDFHIRIYRADFVNTKDGFKMIELNSRPGIMHPEKEGKEFYWDFNGNIIELVKNYFAKAK